MTKEEIIKSYRDNGDCLHISISCRECPFNDPCRGGGEREEIFKNYEKATKKKRGPKPKPNKREKLEARLSQVEETTRNAFRFAPNDVTLAVFNSEGKYEVVENMNPEQAVQFAKWVLDLEGGK